VTLRIHQACHTLSGLGRLEWSSLAADGWQEMVVFHPEAWEGSSESFHPGAEGGFEGGNLHPEAEVIGFPVVVWS